MADADPVISYHLDCTGLPGIPIAVRHMRHVEALNEPYVLQVGVALADPDTDLEPFLGSDVVLHLDRGGSAARRFCGVVRRMSHDTPYLELEVVPALRLLEQRRDSRIFQQMTAPAIVEKVLTEAFGPYGREVSVELEGSYPTREYCVQYRETDLDFVHRLMEEEGIHYAFDHEGDVELMVLRDRNGSHLELPSGGVVPYQAQNLQIRGPEPIHHFTRHHRPQVTSVVTRDWDWTRGGDMKVEAELRGEGPDEQDRESYEHGEGRSLSIWSYDQGVRRYQEQDASSQAEIRKQAHAYEDVVGEGVGRVVAMAPGYTFELEGHPTVGMDGAYLITRVEHVSASADEVIPDFGATESYYNRFECIPLETPYRPARRTPKPVIQAVQTALVTGPAGEEIHVDEHGRIKVQFHWDRLGANDENSSCWVRVQQPWAGAGWGFWWVPRMGMEVVVHFVDGDPDRPLATGTVYDAANPLPYMLPSDKTKSTIKSNSSLGGGGFNEFRFEDMLGSEEIYTHAQKDYDEVVEHDHTTHVKHDQTNTVDNDQTQTIGHDQTETVHGNQALTVDANRTLHVKGDYDETVDGTETRTTTGDVTESFGSNEERTISANVTETISGNEARQVDGDHTETVAGSHTQTVSGDAAETIKSTHSETVVGGITTMTPGSYEITATGAFTAVGVAGIKVLAPGGLTLVGAAGVTRVDSFADWIGQSKSWTGFLKMGGKGLKIEANILAIGGSGVKVEDALSKHENEPVNLLSNIMWLESKATTIRLGSIELEAAQLVRA